MISSIGKSPQMFNIENRLNGNDNAQGNLQIIYFFYFNYITYININWPKIQTKSVYVHENETEKPEAS